jgi:hypothetical protein
MWYLPHPSLTPLLQKASSRMPTNMAATIGRKHTRAMANLCRSTPIMGTHVYSLFYFLFESDVYWVGVKEERKLEDKQIMTTIIRIIIRRRRKYARLLSARYTLVPYHWKDVLQVSSVYIKCDGGWFMSECIHLSED